MSHSFPMTLGLFPGQIAGRWWGGTAAQATAVADFDGDNFDHERLGFISGSVSMAPAEDKPIFNALWTPPSIPALGDRMEALDREERTLSRLDLDSSRCAPL